MNQLKQAYQAGVREGWMAKEAEDNMVRATYGYSPYGPMSKESSLFMNVAEKFEDGVLALANRLGRIKRAAWSAAHRDPILPFGAGVLGGQVLGAGVGDLAHYMNDYGKVKIPKEFLVGAALGVPMGGMGGYLAASGLGVNPWLGATLGSLAGAGLGAGGGALYKRYIA